MSKGFQNRASQTNRLMRLYQLETSDAFGFLPEEDLYLFKKPEAQLKFCLIGAGTIGLEHIRIAGLEGRGFIYCLYDESEKSAHYAIDYAKAYQPQAILNCTSLDDALLDENIDAFIIATPNYTHLEVFLEVATTGKPIYLEKPMAHTLQDAWRLLCESENHPSPIHIGLQYRYKSIYKTLLNDLKNNNDIGKPLMLTINEYRPPFLDKTTQWNKFNTASGGTLIEKCCHYFNLMHLIAGSKPERIYAQGGQALNFKDFTYQGSVADIIDHAMVSIEFEGGMKGQFNLCMFSPSFMEECQVFGSRGKIHVKEEYNPILHRHQPHLFEKLCYEDQTSVTSNPEYAHHIERSGHSGGTYFAHQAFVEAIQPPNTEPTQTTSSLQPATLSESFWSIIISSAAQKSMAEQRPIQIHDFLLEHQIPPDHQLLKA